MQFLASLYLNDRNTPRTCDQASSDVLVLSLEEEREEKETNQVLVIHRGVDCRLYKVSPLYIPRGILSQY